MTETQDGHLKTCYFHTQGPKCWENLIDVFGGSSWNQILPHPGGRVESVIHWNFDRKCSNENALLFLQLFLRPFSCLLAAGSTKDPLSTPVFKEIQCFQMLQLLKCGTGCLWEHPSLWSSKTHFSLSLAMLLSLQYATVMCIWCLLSSQDKCVCSKRLLFGD